MFHASSISVSFISKGIKYSIFSFEHENITRYQMQTFMVIFIPINVMYTGDDAGVLKQIKYFNLRTWNFILYVISCLRIMQNKEEIIMNI